MSVFVKPLMYLNYVWHGDRNCPNFLSGVIHNPVYDLKVKATDFEFLC